MISWISDIIIVAIVAWIALSIGDWIGVAIDNFRRKSK